MARGTTSHGVQGTTIRMGVFGGAWASIDGERRRPTSAKQAALLSLLISQPGTPVAFGAAADALWPQNTAAQGRRSLRVHMSSLRKWLRQTCGDDAADLIETHRLGYRLNIAPECLDWQVFVHQVDQGHRSVGSGDYANALTNFGNAIDAWADPFPELADCVFVEGRRAFLIAQCELAHDEMIEAKLLQGELADVVCTLQERVLLYPYRERACDQLMRALYASGRQAAALDVYRQLYRRLRDDLGLEPGPQIRETQAAILAHDMQTGRGDVLAHDTHLIEAVPVAEVVAVVIDALSGQLDHNQLGLIGTHVFDALVASIPGREPESVGGPRCVGRPARHHSVKRRGIRTRL